MARLIERSRYLILLAVGGTLVASAAAFLWGVWKTIQVIIKLVNSVGNDAAAAVSFIELMDKSSAGVRIVS